MKKLVRYLVLAFILFVFCKYYLGLFTVFIPVDGEGGIVGYYSLEKHYLVVEQKIIMVNPPKNNYILMHMIKEYDRKFPMGKEKIEIGVEKSKKLYIKAGGDSSILDNKLRFQRMFFKESWHTPKDWDGKDDQEREGRISWHGDDLIAIIRWSQDDVAKKYQGVSID